MRACKVWMLFWGTAAEGREEAHDGMTGARRSFAFSTRPAFDRSKWAWHSQGSTYQYHASRSYVTHVFCPTQTACQTPLPRLNFSGTEKASTFHRTGLHLNQQHGLSWPKVPAGPCNLIEASCSVVIIFTNTALDEARPRVLMSPELGISKARAAEVKIETRGALVPRASDLYASAVRPVDAAWGRPTSLSHPSQ